MYFSNSARLLLSKNLGSTHNISSPVKDVVKQRFSQRQLRTSQQLQVVLFGSNFAGFIHVGIIFQKYGEKNDPHFSIKGAGVDDPGKVEIEFSVVPDRGE